MTEIQLITNATELAKAKGYFGVAVIHQGGLTPYVAGVLNSQAKFLHATFNTHENVESALRQLIGELNK